MVRPGSDPPRLQDLRDVYRRMLRIEARIIDVQRKLQSESERRAEMTGYLVEILQQLNDMVRLMSDGEASLQKPQTAEKPKRKRTSRRSDAQ